MATKEELPISIKTHLRTIRTPEHRKGFLELYYYIKQMADDFDVVLSEAELLDIFGIDPATLPTKPEINKRLFQLAQIATAKKDIGDFDPLVVDGLLQNFFNRNDNKDKILRQIRDAQSRIGHYQEDIRNLVNQILDRRRELSLIETGTKSEIFVREMNKIVSSSKFEQVYWYTPLNVLCAVTKPVTLKHGEHSYELGQYVIAFYPSEKNFQIYPHKDNILSDGNENCYHPHVFSNRNICWGNAAATFSELMTTQKIGELFLIANMILHAYNPGSPVIEIENFKSDTTVKLTKHNFYRMLDLPIHTQMIIDLYPELASDSLLVTTYAARIKNVHNFKYTLPTVADTNNVEQVDLNIHSLPPDPLDDYFESDIRTEVA